MTQKHTDHSRQFLVWLNDIMAKAKRDPKRRVFTRGLVADYIAEGTKFLLPGNGVLLDDPHLKGLDEKIPLSLPFPIVCLEFPEVWGQFSKTIITLKQEEEDIIMFVTVFNDNHGSWGTFSPLRFDRKDYIERNEKGEPDFLYHFDPSAPDEIKINQQIYFPYIVVFLQFMNAMACRNVSYERSPPSKVKVAMRKGPIKYDEYKVLTTFVTPRDPKKQNSKPQANVVENEREGGTHASPREHLRRGHIVRMNTGKVYWRNATIVMPGNGGRIEKAYALK